MNAHLYTAASGLSLEQRRVETIAHNLSNLSTAGFRPRRLFATVYEGTSSVPGELPGASSRAVALAGSYEVPGESVRKMTGRALDVALAPDSLLVVNTPAGPRYTRDGALSVAPDGRLSAAGHPLVGPDRKPLEKLSAAASVAPDGRVMDGEREVGRLLLVRDRDSVLRLAGDNLLTADGRDAALETVSDPVLDPGALDLPGGDTLGELVRLIAAQRAFESYQRMLDLTMNEVNRKTVNELTS